MRYLKPLFESKRLNGITQKALIDADLTKDQYMEMIDFVGRCGYSEVKAALPFLLRMIEEDNYDISALDLSMLIRFYKMKKAKVDELESIEDYFLDIIEDKSNDIRIGITKDDNTIDIRIIYTDLSDLGQKMAEIDKRFKRAGQEYRIYQMSSSVLVQEGNMTCIFLKVNI
jgi:hypothetical protein